MTLQPGMRVLDMGCGKAASSVLLAREFGVQVYAVDLWTPASENFERLQKFGFADQIIPLHCDLRSLPFPSNFFDAIVAVDSYYYVGTDALYLNYIANFLKPGGQLGIAGAGLMQPLSTGVPDHLKNWWTQDLWAIKSAEQMRQLWEPTGIVSIEVADTMEDGWKTWLAWQEQIAPNNHVELASLHADMGRYLGYVRVIGTRRTEATLESYCWPDPLKSMSINFTPPASEDSV